MNFHYYLFINNVIAYFLVIVKYICIYFNIFETFNKCTFNIPFIKKVLLSKLNSFLEALQLLFIIKFD